MPVSLLLCEGKPNGPDVRVLAKLLAGRCQVQPCGGKYGMGDRVLARREALRSNTVFGLLDGDFQPEWKYRTDKPRPWTASDRTVLGWRWERKEIENYLIDPNVVSRALGSHSPPPAEYGAALKDARNRVADYQAARIALSIHRARFSPLPNAFGRERGQDRHPLPDLDTLNEEGYLAEIRSVVRAYNASHSVALDAVEAEFGRRLPECRADGGRFRDFIAAFAGKDLLHAMQPSLEKWGIASPAVFVERILVAISSTAEDIGDWLSEWSELRNAIDSI